MSSLASAGRDNGLHTGLENEEFPVSPVIRFSCAFQGRFDDIYDGQNLRYDSMSLLGKEMQFGRSAASLQFAIFSDPSLVILFVIDRGVFPFPQFPPVSLCFCAIWVPISIYSLPVVEGSSF